MKKLEKELEKMIKDSLPKQIDIDVPVYLKEEQKKLISNNSTDNFALKLQLDNIEKRQFDMNVKLSRILNHLENPYGYTYGYTYGYFNNKKK